MNLSLAFSRDVSLGRLWSDDKQSKRTLESDPQGQSFASVTVNI